MYIVQAELLAPSGWLQWMSIAVSTAACTQGGNETGCCSQGRGKDPDWIADEAAAVH